MSKLFHLLHLADPALPIGSFAHSAGMETYVQLGLVHDKHSATEFIIGQLEQNIANTDAALLSLAYDAAKANDLTVLIRVNDECNAVKLPMELRQASLKLGARLLKIFTRLNVVPEDDPLMTEVQKSGSGFHYAVVFGFISERLGIDKQEALTGFFYNVAAGMVTNAVKLVPLGQLDGQEILFSFHSLIHRLTENCLEPNTEMIGACCAGFDIRSMQHETIYSRLYMS